MAKIAASLAFFPLVSCSPVSASATLDFAEVGDDQAACEMQTTLLQTKTEMRDAKRLHINGKSKTSLVTTLFANAKVTTAQRSGDAKLEGLQFRQEACPIADETEDNTVVASLVPNNGFVCYGGTKRELDQAYCLLQTAPTRALYRAGDSPWFQGDDAPTNVEVQLESCESRGYEFLLHDPDDCWAPVQKFIRNGEQGDEDFENWELAQVQNWQNYDALHGLSFSDDAADINNGMFLSGCICLEGSDVANVMEEICAIIHNEGFLPIHPPASAESGADGADSEHGEDAEDGGGAEAGQDVEESEGGDGA